MNTRNIVLLNILLWIFFFNHERLIEAQSILSQSIKGKVVEKETQNPIEGAIVMIPNTNHAIATTTDSLGNFCLKNVEIGRHDILINMLGYEPYVVREILVTSGKEVVINAELTEKINQIAELVVKAEKGKPTNSMAMVSSRQFNIEEASRYAGGYNDPSRLASSFAGVAGSLSTNAIVIRGNSPKGLLWRMENTDIPNPSHFSDVSVVGAGALTALSSQMLSNSDFYTGAFPAEFGNALSGVFDIKLRNGNNYKNENTIQLGIIGTDISSEGPFGKNNNSSYLFNYRYSTLSLLSPILPPEMGILRYQDFAFKVNVHSTDGKNNLSIWGLGTLDYQHHPAVKDSFDWNSDYDKTDFFVDAYMGVIGINYRIHHGQKTFSNISISSVTQKLVYDKKEIDKTYYLNPLSHLENKNWRYSLSYTIQHKFNARITNRTGITINRLYYQIGSEKTENINKKNTYISGNGNGNLIQLFTQSKYNLSDKIKVTAGIYSQYFELNNEISFEPRIATKYDVNNKFYIAFSYGRHSQIEPLYIYYTTIEENGKYIYPNKKIKFSYSDHYVLSFNYKINSNLALKIEPYYQKLDNIPVVLD